jgi:predicted dehydrogenase
MPGELRWGFVGAGAVAHAMAGDLALVSGNRLVAVTGKTTQRARKLGNTFAARVEPSTDALLAAADVDVVYVASPPSLHAEHCIAALGAGKHVLVEKPFATSTDDARRMVEAARSSNRFCMEAMWARFVPAVKHAIVQARSGALGELRQFTADFSFALRVEPGRHVFGANGGGALLDRGVYGISVACAALGRPTSVISTAQIGTTGVDEEMAVLLSHETGALSTITASLRTIGTNHATIRGTSATIELAAPFFMASQYSTIAANPTSALDDERASRDGSSAIDRVTERLTESERGRRLISTAKSFARAGAGELRATKSPLLGRGYAHQLDAVAQAILSGRTEEPTMSLDDTIMVMEVLDRARNAWKHPIR